MTDKPKSKKIVLIPFLVLHVAVLVVTWRDLKKRTDAQVRGNKVLWRAASAANTLGSGAYWVFGRRRQG